MLGYPDQALRSAHDGLRLAQALAHPFSQALALSWITIAHTLRREWQAVQEHADMAISLCTARDFQFWGSWATFLKGGALAQQGQAQEGIRLIRHGRSIRQTIGDQHDLPLLLSILAQAYTQQGQAEEGLTEVSAALERVDTTGERIWAAELYRLKGELVLIQEDTEQKSHVKGEKEAQEYFHTALELARQQQAKSLELRAATSLARLWQSQGKSQEARDLLAPVYHWFTEGFDTADLKDAKTLLDELAEDM